MGKSTLGARNVLIKRYEMYSPGSDPSAAGGSGPGEDTVGAEGTAPHASDNPMIVMVDESTGNKYMRVVPHKGLGAEGDNSSLIKDMHQELKTWGHPGGGHNALILKSDGEPALVAVREALARCHGGRIPPEQPPKGEHESNGLAEEAGRTVRDQARVLKLHLQANIGREVLADEPIMPWLIRWAAM